MLYYFNRSSNLILQNPLRTVCSEEVFGTIRDNVYSDTVLRAEIRYKQQRESGAQALHTFQTV